MFYEKDGKEIMDRWISVNILTIGHVLFTVSKMRLNK